MNYGTSLIKRGKCGNTSSIGITGEPQRVISAMVDAGTLPGFVAMQDGDPVAYTFYVEVSGKGLLGGCFASEWAAPEGVEHRLLEESLAALKRNPCASEN